MRRAERLAVVLLLVTGCASSTRWERAAPAADPTLQQDEYECRREGLLLGTGTGSPVGIPHTVPAPGDGRLHGRARLQEGAVIWLPLM